MSSRWLWLGSLLPFVAAAALAQLKPQVTRKLPPDADPAEEAFIHTPAGFSKEGRPAVAEGGQTGTVRLTVLDADTGKPTFCRVNVVGGDGNYYEPADHTLAPWSLHRLANRP